MDAATRPALADVLGVVGDTHWWADASSWEVLLRNGPLPMTAAGVTLRAAGFERVAPWRYDTPAAALEALVAHGAVPPHWTDAARAPRWWCERCKGRGHVGCDCAAHRGPSPFDFVSDGSQHAPPSLPALVAVASLGVATLARAEELVAETWPGRALVWRPMTAEALREHHARGHWGLHGVDGLPSAASAAAEGYVECPPVEEWCASEVYAAWGAIRELLALGLHLVALDGALDDARVVLAVEHVGEGQREEVAA